MVSGQSHSLVGLVDKPAAPTPSYTPSTPQQASQGSSYSSAPVYATPAPSYNYTSSAPNMNPSTLSYTAPSSGYSGSSNVIGNISGSNDLGKSYIPFWALFRPNHPRCSIASRACRPAKQKNFSPDGLKRYNTNLIPLPSASSPDC